MKLTWGEDYEALAEVARAVFAQGSPLNGRKAAPPFAEQLTQLAELGWIALGDPRGPTEDEPGLGTIAALFVEAGRTLSPTPLPAIMRARDVLLASTAPGAVPLVVDLERGRTVVMSALFEASWGMPVPLFRDGALDGTTLAVPFASEADLFVVEATDSSGEALLVLVPAGAAVSVEPMPNLGGHPLSAVTFGAVPVDDDHVLARGDEARRAVEIARRRAAVLTGARIHGAGLALQAMTVQYAKARHQYGGPIGRFQAVQYLCTDIAIGVHLVSALTREAARVIDAGGDAEIEVALLGSQAQTTAQQMVHAAHEVHAGIGYMRESDVHLFTEITRLWGFELGSETELHRRVVKMLREDAGVMR